MSGGAMLEELDGAYYANLVRMLRRTHRHLAACLVEGADDEKLYGSMFGLDQCEITAVRGWNNAVDALALLEKSSVPGVLAIIDADSARHEKRTPSSPNLLWTDHHDLEIDLVHSPAFDRVVHEFCPRKHDADDEERPRRPTPEEIRQQVLATAAPLGYLRLHSERTKLYLKFTGLTYSDFVDKENLEVDHSRMVRAVKNRSQRPDLVEDELVKAVHEIQKQEHDLRLICRGHDFTAIFSLGLRKFFAKRAANEVPPDRIEENLRSSFHYTDFQQTKMYNELREWETRNEPYTLLREQ